MGTSRPRGASLGAFPPSHARAPSFIVSLDCCLGCLHLFLSVKDKSPPAHWPAGAASPTSLRSASPRSVAPRLAPRRLASPRFASPHLASLRLILPRQPTMGWAWLGLAKLGWVRLGLAGFGWAWLSLLGLGRTWVGLAGFERI